MHADANPWFLLFFWKSKGLYQWKISIKTDLLLKFQRLN